MPIITLVYGEQSRQIEAPENSILGEAVAAAGLSLEQPCAGRGTCGKCKVLAETGLAAPDEIEHNHLTPGELALGRRLACRARIMGDARVVLAPNVVYSNKIFRNSVRYKQTNGPLGLAIDLGSTTVAAFLTLLEDGEVQAGGASLNQQTIFGADVISRLAAAYTSAENSARLQRLALASINQAVDSLNLSSRIRQRIERVVIVGNVAMHHLLVGLPVHTIAHRPFQPLQKTSILNANALMQGIFREDIQVSLPPLIGGFVGSDALACLAYFRFDCPKGPMAVIDLGTNGEVLVTDGERILTASTAAGPAFEGVNISCGTRAVDGAIIGSRIEGGDLILETINQEAPVGLTGSGLLSLIYELRKEDIILPNGRFSAQPHPFSTRMDTDPHGVKRLPLTGDHRIGLTQWDIRELQKAKGAIRAALDILLRRLALEPKDIDQFILTGSFGGQVSLDAVLDLGMIPPVRREVVKAIPNGAGLGAAMFLSPDGFARAEAIAAQAQQIDLDQDPDFEALYIRALSLEADPEEL